MLTQNTVILLVVIESAGLAITVGMLITTIIAAKKARREVDALKLKIAGVASATRNFIKNLETI